MSHDSPQPSEPSTPAPGNGSGIGGTGGTDGAGGGLLSNPRFLAAAVVVGLLVVLAVVLAILGPADDDGTPGADPGPGTSTTTSSPDASEASGNGGGSVCGLDRGSQQIPTTAPEADWELVGTVAAPHAPDTIGPGETSDGLRQCFAQSPTGALFAAVNFVATTSDADLRADAVRQLAARGQGRTAALKAATSNGSGSGESSTKFQVAGFAVLNYDSRSSAVELAFRANTGGLIRLPVSLRWEQGDWKVVLPPDGDLYAALGNLPDLTGYVPWSGA
jgi:hypothetical protein